MKLFFVLAVLFFFLCVDSDSLLIDMVDEGKIGLREVVRSLHEVACVLDTDITKIIYNVGKTKIEI